MNKFVNFVRTVFNMLKPKKNMKKSDAKNETHDIYRDPSIRVNYRDK